MVVKVKEKFQKTRHVKNKFYVEKEISYLILYNDICMNNMNYYTCMKNLTYL